MPPPERLVAGLTSEPQARRHRSRNTPCPPGLHATPTLGCRHRACGRTCADLGDLRCPTPVVDPASDASLQVAAAAPTPARLSQIRLGTGRILLLGCRIRCPHRRRRLLPTELRRGTGRTSGSPLRRRQGRVRGAGARCGVAGRVARCGVPIYDMTHFFQSLPAGQHTHTEMMLSDF
jgi:hypothetical protein